MEEGKKPSPADELAGPKYTASTAVHYSAPHTGDGQGISFTKFTKDAAFFAVHPSAPHTRDEQGISFPNFFEQLSQVPVNQVQAQDRGDLSIEEFLELLKSQSPTAGFSFQGSSSKSQSMHNMDKNKFYHSVAIDQCDITSSVDYGSRDYYPPSKSTSETPYAYKESELDELYKTCTDTRGNWWQGSFYY